MGIKHGPVSHGMLLECNNAVRLITSLTLDGGRLRRLAVPKIHNPVYDIRYTILLRFIESNDILFKSLSVVFDKN